MNVQSKYADLIAGVLLDIGEHAAREADDRITQLRRWSADMNRAMGQIQPIGDAADQAALWIGRAKPLTCSEVVAIANALYRALEVEAHNTIHRDAMASLVDMAQDFAGEIDQGAEDEQVGI
jgi:hypothetical protein